MSTSDSDNVFSVCYNCQRQQNAILLDDYPLIYHLDFYHIFSSQIQKYKSFKLFNINYQDNEERHIFCYQCYTHLSSTDKEKSNNVAYTWPSFVWYLLCDESFCTHYSPKFLWKFIPKIWRYWWVDGLMKPF